MLAKLAHQARMNVQATLADAPQLTQDTFLVSTSMVRPWQHQKDSPQTWEDKRLDSAGLPLTADGLVLAKNLNDFVSVVIDGKSQLVSKMVAQKMGLLSGIELDEEPESSDADLYSTVVKKEITEQYQEDAPQAGGSAAAAAAELAKVKKPDVDVKDATPKTPSDLKEPSYLRHHIPKNDLPEVLFVRAPWRKERADCDGYGHRIYDDSVAQNETMVYVRVLPTPVRNPPTCASPKTGFLHVDMDRLGSGNAGTVSKCIFTPDLSTPSTESYQAVVKLATTTYNDWDSVKKFTTNEAQTYCAMPEWLSDDVGGYAVVPPMTTPQKLGAIVPKFYGLYVRADGTKASLEQQAEKAKSAGDAMEWTFSDLRQPIMILEECGSPIQPHYMDRDERTQVYAMMLRLHRAGFMQGSIATRNILVRTEKDDDGRNVRKYRIVDFGRGTTVSRSKYSTRSAERETLDTLLLRDL